MNMYKKAPGNQTFFLKTKTKTKTPSLKELSHPFQKASSHTFGSFKASFKVLEENPEIPERLKPTKEIPEDMEEKRTKTPNVFILDIQRYNALQMTL